MPKTQVTLGEVRDQMRASIETNKQVHFFIGDTSHAQFSMSIPPEYFGRESDLEDWIFDKFPGIHVDWQ